MAGSQQLVSSAVITILLLFILLIAILKISDHELKQNMLTGKSSWLDNSDALSFCAHCTLQLRHGEWRFIEGTAADNYGNCSSIWSRRDDVLLERATHGRRLGSGWNKNVYQFDHKSVLKTLNLRGAAVQRCVNTNNQKGKDCLSEAIKRFVRELRVLIDLNGDPGVPQVYAYCVPEDAHAFADRVAIVMASGRPLDTIYLVQKTWLHRLGLVAKIIEFIERIHPYRLNDLRRQQFVMMGDYPAYVDYDDITVDKNPYNANSKSDRSAQLLYDAFIKDFFWYGSPQAAKQEMDQLRHFYNNQSLTLAVVKRHVQQLTVIS